MAFRACGSRSTRLASPSALCLTAPALVPRPPLPFSNPGRALGAAVPTSRPVLVSRRFSSQPSAAVPLAPAPPANNTPAKTSEGPRQTLAGLLRNAAVAGVAHSAPPNYDMDITVDKDNLTVFNLRSRASEAVIPWNQLSSVAICVDGAKQAKYFHICRTDKSFIDVPLSIPSQEKFSKRLDRLPGFHMVRQRCKPLLSLFLNFLSLLPGRGCSSGACPS
jgi:hypothetical protein